MSLLQNLTPLAVVPQNDRLKRFSIVSHNKKTSPGTGKLVVAENIRQEEVARRIVACVNACDGVETDRLEDGMRVKQVHSQMLSSMGERYQLLSALEALLDLYQPITGNPTHEELVEHWLEEKSQGRGDADVFLAALSAVRAAKGGAA